MNKIIPVLAAAFVTTLPAVGAAGAQEVKAQGIDFVTGAVKYAELADLPQLRGASLNLIEPMDETFGATLQPVSPVLRSQLSLPEGQGLLVAQLRSDGPIAQAGLRLNDVLLTLADKPLAAANDISKQLKAGGDTPVTLTLVRSGKPLAVRVRPIYRVTMGPVEAQKKEYFIGVQIQPADDACRAQLDLPAGEGAVVNEVVGGSPAEKAGVKKSDIVLELEGNPIDKPETLSARVQEIKDKPAELVLLRSGKRVSCRIVATTREVEAYPELGAIRLLLVGDPANQLNVNYTTTPPEDLGQRLTRLENEINALRKTLDKINESLKAGKTHDRE